MHNYDWLYNYVGCSMNTLHTSEQLAAISSYKPRHSLEHTAVICSSAGVSSSGLHLAVADAKAAKHSELEAHNSNTCCCASASYK